MIVFAFFCDIYLLLGIEIRSGVFIGKAKFTSIIDNVINGESFSWFSAIFIKKLYKLYKLN